jgi:hypothetical protein
VGRVEAVNEQTYESPEITDVELAEGFEATMPNVSAISSVPS